MGVRCEARRGRMLAMGGKGARVASRLAGIVAVAVVVICAGSLQVRGQCAVDEYLNGGTCTGCAHTSATCGVNVDLHL